MGQAGVNKLTAATDLLRVEYAHLRDGGLLHGEHECIHAAAGGGWSRYYMSARYAVFTVFLKV